MNELTAYSDGTSIGNSQSFTVVIWTVVSENASDSKLFINLPSGGYTTSTAAIADADGKNNYSIPQAYHGTALLLAALTITRSGGGGTWTNSNLVDLRGTPATTLAGTGAASSISDHGDLSGLSDDDHTQYLLTDGTRDVTGNQAGTVSVLDGDSQNINPDFSLSNTYFVALEKNTTINNPTNLPGAGVSTTVQIVTEQPASGFYSITWGDQYMFPLEQLGSRGGPNATLADNCIDVFTFVSIPGLSQGEKLLGVSSHNFY
jgi:hypothetical protein